MNVAIIMERIETWRGGAETSTMQFAQHLARLGCKVSILTASHAQSTPDIHIIPIKANATFRASKTLLFARRAADYVRKHDFDIVHSITPCMAADVYQPRGGTVPETLQRNVALRSAALQKGLKRIGQQLSLKYRIVGNLERKLLHRKPPPWVIAISQYVADQLERHYQFNPDRVRLIFNGVDPHESTAAERHENRRQIRKQFHLHEDDVVALCVAHNFKLKGVAKLIEALARVHGQGRGENVETSKHRNVEKEDRANSSLITHYSSLTSQHSRLVALIVGRDNLAPYIRLAERHGVADRVLFSGPTQRIQMFFHAADFLVHPTFYDPCSRVVLEAMAAGLPAITTKFNGAAERITDGKEGYVIDSPNDIAALTDRIDRLSDEEFRRKCGQQARKAVEGFSMAKHAERTLQLYEEIIRTGQTQRAHYR